MRYCLVFVFGFGCFCLVDYWVCWIVFGWCCWFLVCFGWRVCFWMMIGCFGCFVGYFCFGDFCCCCCCCFVIFVVGGVVNF